MADAKIGSSEWFTQQADKVIATGLDVLKFKMTGIDDTGGSNPGYVSPTTSSTKWLPYALGAAGIGIVVLILAKR